MQEPRLCNCSNLLWDMTIDDVNIFVGWRRQLQRDTGREPQGATTAGDKELGVTEGWKAKGQGY